MFGLLFEACLICLIAKFFFLKNEDSTFIDALVPAFIIAIVNTVLVMFLPILLALPVVIAADSLILGGYYGLRVKESGLFALTLFATKFGIALMFM